MFRFYWGGLVLSMMHFRVLYKLVVNFSVPSLLGLLTVIFCQRRADFFDPKLFMRMWSL